MQTLIRMSAAHFDMTMVEGDWSTGIDIRAALGGCQSYSDKYDFLTHLGRIVCDYHGIVERPKVSVTAPPAKPRAAAKPTRKAAPAARRPARSVAMGDKL